jgi:hypothetical protein
VRLASASLKNSMPPKEYNTINIRTIEPKIAILCRRKRRQVSCPRVRGGVSSSSGRQAGNPLTGLGNG